MIPQRLLIEWCLIAAAAIALVSGLVLTAATARLDNIVYDRLVGAYAAPPSDRILIVAIDDQSLAALGRWPWPRSVHAAMLQRLAAARPAAVAYDVLFTEPGPPADDHALAAAMQAVGSVGLPVLMEAPGKTGQAIDVTPPTPAILAAAAGTGHVMLATDADGTARGGLLNLSAGGRHWLHLMEWTYRTVAHRTSPAFRRAEASDELVTIPFQSFGGEFRTVSFASVVAGEVPAQFLKDRAILVGATAGGLGDRYRVPLRRGSTMPGIEIQANMLNGLLADRLVRPAGLPVMLAASLLPSVILLLAFWRLPPGQVLVLSLGLLLAGLLISALLLVVWGFWLPPAPGLAGLFLIYPLWGWRRLQAVDRDVGHELSLFAAESRILAGPRRTEALDAIGGNVARLRDFMARARDLRRLLDDVVDGVSDPLVATDLDDQLVLANRPGMALLDLEFGGGAASERLTRDTGIVFRADAVPSEIAVPDGRIFSVRRSPLCGADGVQRGWVLLFANISAIRQVERDREETLEFLSHDMRSPQASIIALLDSPARDVTDRDLRQRIRGHALRTLRLADHFVQLARMKVAKFSPEPFDLADAFTEARDELWSRARQRGITITCEGFDQACAVLGEQDAVTRALVNLIDNAVKYAPEGGEVRCSLLRQPGAAVWTCRIDDDGPGIAPTLRPHLFGRFAAAPGAGGAVGHSAGLGLAYVRLIAERHNGSIAWEPRAPAGSRFTLQIPALDAL